MRLRKVIKKEFIEIGRDRAFLLFLIFLPIILMTVMGYAFQADIKNLRTAVINEDSTEYSQVVVRVINDSEYFKYERYDGELESAIEKLERSRYRAVVHIPPDFGEKIENATTPDITLYLDSSDYTVYNILKGAAGELVRDSMQDLIELVVDDLEGEKQAKILEMEEIQFLMKDIEHKTQKEMEIIDEINLESYQSQLRELQFFLNKLIVGVPYTEEVEQTLEKLKEAKLNLAGQKEDMERFKNKSLELNQSYQDIQDRVDRFDLELGMLKKDFLSFPLGTSIAYLFGEISYFDYLTPAIITLILFFIGFAFTTVNFIDERKANTLFRVMATPLKKGEFLFGKFVVFFFIGFLEALYVLGFSILVFKINIVGSLYHVLVVLALLMAAAIGLGLLVSSVVRTMRQASMALPLVVISMLLISQTFSPIEVMPKFMQYVAYLSPMLYSNIALREIMIKGSSLGAIWLPVLILGIYAFVAILIGVAVSKKRIA